MQYVKLGNTGIDVSRLCLGCMGFGQSEGWIHDWTLCEADSLPIIKKALEMGINFFDTANIYSLGNSEKILGKAIKEYANRDEVVIATKVWGEMRKGPNGKGLSRKAILSEMDKSLKRLQMDYIDLYIIHRWDYETPIEETMEALNDLVRAGKTRYIGASAMYAWQFQKARNIAEKHGWANFVSMQNHVNLIYREEEREMIPYCKDQNIALTPYSPLASGRLAHDSTEKTKRLESDQVAKSKYDVMAQADKAIIERLAEVAQNHDVPRAQIALAWLMQKQPITVPIIGATKFSHLENTIPAIDIQLSSEEIIYMEEPYIPHKVVGAQ